MSLFTHSAMMNLRAILEMRDMVKITMNIIEDNPINQRKKWIRWKNEVPRELYPVSLYVLLEVDVWLKLYFTRWLVIQQIPQSSLYQCKITFWVHHPPRTWSSLKNHFSAPNHRTDMTFFVYDPNTSKNIWKFVQVFFIIKNCQKKYNNLVSVVWY